MKANRELRIAILESGFTQRQICEEMGVHESYLSTILRSPCTPYQSARITKAIDELTLKADKNKPTTKKRSR